MNEQNNNKPKETPKSIPGGAAAAKSKGWRKVLTSKWVTPAAFMAAAAIIVTLMWLYRGDQPDQTTTTPTDTEVSQGEDVTTKPADDTIAVTATGEEMQWPVANFNDLEVSLPYYDAAGTNEEKQAAFVQQDNKFTPHVGLDLQKPDNTTFDVLAALSGKVTHVEQHPINGATVEISHGNGLVTIYQSLSDVTVKEGDEVKQGTAFAKAGRNDLEKEEGIHLHFEARQDGKVVNPNELVQK
ncbi:Peptidase M23 [Paenibacillus curdlanolyticus YK9]|uniref:Peptidase M23 n=1 Tax=Paenibacillus curdlanolyticus YK9 TaxID=717606 RepID=E0IEG8_9BACL|nr:M23 family metallopeptidase [Paenibacillus curdlanolyticus]EFM09056.1 Peptidase M23 [Paenibacillus curdlanolyticus YK9]